MYHQPLARNHQPPCCGPRPGAEVRGELCSPGASEAAARSASTARSRLPSQDLGWSRSLIKTCRSPSTLEILLRASDGLSWVMSLKSLSGFPARTQSPGRSRGTWGQEMPSTFPVRERGRSPKTAAAVKTVMLDRGSDSLHCQPDLSSGGHGAKCLGNGLRV